MAENAVMRKSAMCVQRRISKVKRGGSGGHKSSLRQSVSTYAYTTLSHHHHSYNRHRHSYHFWYNDYCNSPSSCMYHQRYRRHGIQINHAQQQHCSQAEIMLSRPQKEEVYSSNNNNNINTTNNNSYSSSRRRGYTYTYRGGRDIELEMKTRCFSSSPSSSSSQPQTTPHSTSSLPRTTFTRRRVAMSVSIITSIALLLSLIFFVLPSMSLLSAPTHILRGAYKSFALIILSEIGDKTFFIAALLAMRDNNITSATDTAATATKEKSRHGLFMRSLIHNHTKVAVFLGAMTALTAMSAISVIIGSAHTFITSSMNMNAHQSSAVDTLLKLLANKRAGELISSAILVYFGIRNISRYVKPKTILRSFTNLIHNTITTNNNNSNKSNNKSTNNGMQSIDAATTTTGHDYDAASNHSNDDDTVKSFIEEEMEDAIEVVRKANEKELSESSSRSSGGSTVMTNTDGSGINGISNSSNGVDSHNNNTNTLVSDTELDTNNSIVVDAMKQFGKAVSLIFLAEWGDRYVCHEETSLILLLLPL